MTITYVDWQTVHYNGSAAHITEYADSWDNGAEEILDKLTMNFIQAR